MPGWLSFCLINVRVLLFARINLLFGYRIRMLLSPAKN